MTEPILSAEGLGKRYTGHGGEVRALDDVSLEVGAGEFVAVCGPSGCGKSTLLLVLGALLHPDEGAVQIAGEDPYALGSGSRAAFRGSNIGFVFQEFHLVPYLNVRENILTPTLACEVEGVDGRVEELLGSLGMAERAEHLPSELSAGEQQRTALARALLASPKLILADEPTGNLDRENAERVLGHLADYAAAGAAVVMVTHDEAAMAAAGRRVVMDSGRLTGERNDAS
jgi:putative ABC transport system ATP-binding protein